MVIVQRRAEVEFSKGDFAPESCDIPGPFNRASKEDGLVICGYQIDPRITLQQGLNSPAANPVDLKSLFEESAHRRDRHDYVPDLAKLHNESTFVNQPLSPLSVSKILTLNVDVRGVNPARGAAIPHQVPHCFVSLKKGNASLVISS